MKPIPAELLCGPFTRAQALDAGVTKKMLEGQRFEPVHRGVWRHRDHQMTGDDWVRAAQMALPPQAHLTGISRLQALGLDFGPRLPVRFVVEGDLHLSFENVFLHRTKQLAPVDDVGVVVSGAFIAFCARARVIDAIQVGDWLLHQGHTSIEDVRTLALSATWRHGADEALWILDHLDARARSLKESEMRGILSFAGLPPAEVNAVVPVSEDVTVIGDLWYPDWRVLVEYEGSQHQEDRTVYLGDLDRYELIRGSDLRYVQATKERLRHARTFVGTVFRQLLVGGYTGPPPRFGNDWTQLFSSVSAAVGPRGRRSRSAVG